MSAGKEKRRAINGLWLNHTTLVSGAEESMRAVLAQWQRGKRGEFRDIDTVAALPGDGPLSQQLRGDGIGVVFAPLRRLSRPSGLFDSASLVTHVLQTVPFVSRLVRQTNSHIIHSNSSTAHLIGGIAARRLAMPALWHARDLAPLGRGARYLSSRATWVIAISGCVAESLQKQGVPEGKIRIIRNGIDVESWKPNARAPRALRRQLRWADEFVFGCVGQMVPWKRHEDFIRAAALLCQDEGCSRARFVIVGGDLWNEHASYLGQLSTLSRQLGLGERLRFIEYQRDNHDMMLSLDCLVHAALEEPLGRVLLEALALGVPAIAYGRNGPLEIIRHEHDGLLAQAGEIEDLARQMRRVLQDEELREHLSQHGPQSIREKFHIGDTARATAELYREAVG